MDTERDKEYRHLLELKGRDELKIIAKRLKVAGFSRLSKSGLIAAILEADPTGKSIKPVTWWNRYHNHVYGVASIVGLVLAVIFFILQNSQQHFTGSQGHSPSASPENPAPSNSTANSNDQIPKGQPSATPSNASKSQVTSGVKQSSNAPVGNPTTSSTNKTSNEGVAATLPTSPESQPVPTQADHTELEIVGYDGKSTFLSGPSIAYPSTFGPSRTTEGIAVRRGVEQSTLLWSRIQRLTFRSRQEKNEKGTTVWKHDVSATLTNDKVIDVEIVDDWNMAYMGGGGTGLLFGQSDLGETKISFSKISVLKVLKYTQPTKK